MNEFSITDAAFAGFGVLRRKPLAALVWAGICAGFVGVAFLLFGTSVGVAFLLFGASLITNIIAFAHLADNQTMLAGQPPTDEFMRACFRLFGSWMGLVLLLNAGLIFLGGVITCAVYRSVLEPEASSFFYLRVSAAEGWYILVNFVKRMLLGMVISMVAMPFYMIMVFTMMGVIASSGPDHSHLQALWVLIPLMMVGVAVIMGMTLWLQLRFSMSGPMSFAERKFRLFESWNLTKGHGWRLLGVALLVGVICWGVEMILELLGIGGLFLSMGGLLSSHTPPSPEQLMAALPPFAGLVVVLIFIGAVILIPLVTAPFARVYQLIRPQPETPTPFAGLDQGVHN